MRTTKRENKVKTEMAALSRRLLDIASGAYGAYEDFPDLMSDTLGSLPTELGTEAFGRFVGAVERSILKPSSREYIARPSNYAKWDTLPELVKFMHDNGVR